MPNQYVNKVVQSNGTTIIDISDTTAVASDVASGKYFYLASGEKVVGTASGGGTPSATAHTIVFELETGPDVTITAYYDSTWISDVIRATTPTTYNGVAVESASLDNVAWYTKPSGTWQTVWEGTNTPTTDGGEYFWITDMSAVDVARGSTWRITIDGTAYVCTSKQATIAYLGEWTVLGNPGQAGGTDDGSGVPFCFYNYNGQAFCGDTNLPVKSYSLKFERQISA